MPTTQRSHWWILILLALAQFMVVLDVSIVNVALPAIQESFKMSTSSLQWVVTAYTLAFGGFLLLGGRAADLYGRKKLFIIGTALFGLASLINGFSHSGEMLIIMRAIQGLSAALMSPAALSIVLVTYKEGHERNTALSVWGAVASGGAAAGVLLGGIITEYWGWRWNFFINIPVAAGVIIAAWKLLPAHESEETHNELDLPGAASITGALIALVYALVEAPSKGWTSSSTFTYLAISALLLGFFVWNERRVAHPLVPFKIFRVRNVTGANIVQMPIVAGMFSTFFFTSLYLQLVLGFSPVKTGLCFLAVPFSIAISASTVPKLVRRIGFKPILMVAPLIVAAGLFYLSRLRVDGTYWHDLLPGLILLGLGMGGNFIAITIAATSGVQGKESGLASGLLNTSQQIGGAIGLAVLTGVATSAATNYIKNLGSTPNKLTPLAAQVQGFHDAFIIAACFMIGAAVLAAILLKQPKLTAQERSEEAAAIGMH